MHLATRNRKQNVCGPIKDSYLKISNRIGQYNHFNWLIDFATCGCGRGGLLIGRRVHHSPLSSLSLSSYWKVDTTRMWRNCNFKLSNNLCLCGQLYPGLKAIKLLYGTDKRTVIYWQIQVTILSLLVVWWCSKSFWCVCIAAVAEVSIMKTNYRRHKPRFTFFVARTPITVHVAMLNVRRKYISFMSSE